MKKTKLLSTTGIAIAALLLILINLVGALVFKSVKIDLTENRLYTLSDGTRNILSALDEPVTLRFYFSEKVFAGIPGIQSYGNRVKELLEEYAAIAGDKVRLVIADPEPFSDEEDQAVRYGLQGVPVDAVGSLGYFGLVGTNAVDDQEKIPFFAPDKEESLEYDLTKLVHKLATSKLPSIGLISGLPMQGGQANPFMPTGNQEWFILNQIRQSFNLRQFEADVETLPDDLDVLMLVHPKNLGEKTLFAIDQFVLKGGRVLAFVDPFSEADVPATDPNNPMAAFQAPRNSDLGKLFDAWGIELAKNQIVGDRLAATRVTARAGQRVQAMDYVAWLSMTENNFSQTDFVTGDLKKLSMATAGFIRKKESGVTDVQPIVTTSEQAMAMSQSLVQFGPNPAEMLRNYRPGGESLTLAARITGKVKSAFPDGIKDGDSTRTGLKESEENINVIVVADTDMLEDKLWVDVQNFFGNRMAFPRTNNDVFVVNALENLSGSNDLISLRSRGKSARPFDKVLALKQEAEAQFRDKEKQLQDKLRETERKLSELQREKDGNSSVILTAAQRQEIDNFRAQQVQTRKELRNVQHELGKNIESLGSWLKFINIALVPFLVVALAIALGVARNKRLKASFGN